MLRKSVLALESIGNQPTNQLTNQPDSYRVTNQSRIFKLDSHTSLITWQIESINPSSLEKAKKHIGKKSFLFFFAVC